MNSCVVSPAVSFVVDEPDIAVGGRQVAHKPITTWTEPERQQTAFEDFVYPRESRYIGNRTKRDGADLASSQRPMPLKQTLEINGD